MPREEAWKRYRTVLWTGLGLVLLVTYFSLTHGVMEMTARDVLKTLLRIDPVRRYDLLILEFRLPRIVTAGLVGAALGVAGAAIQGIIRNGLADPGILGINSGAGVGIVTYIVFFQEKIAGTGWLAVMAMPFCGLMGGLGAALLIYYLARQNGRLDPQRLLLTGIAVSSGLGAVILYVTLKMSSGDFQMAAIWLAGSVDKANWRQLAALLPWLGILIPLLIRKAQLLDVFQLEESSVRSLGVAAEKEKAFFLLSAVGLVGACVSVAGGIGFVGLIAPHMARRLAGIAHRRMIPVSGMLGMLLVISADWIARTLFAPAEIAVGIIISLIGAPYFIYLLFTAKA
ncbi:bacillibactin ABC transporter integral membrane protein [Hydrogenispora ethanolica]|uniref:Bacillibactin ABC transporter integral membrane protein n=1 Tax=Hydrogenispora ethanolica TaxID=1082276 RepID=A0A4R1RXI8_HYDET|nr:iron ABC transporter permease [Hydrogenispora ethanolica]TCL70692.1 bacillibactin ABC transporter integral membrane protein [Hydrogenispora ethanolica]